MKIKISKNKLNITMFLLVVAMLFMLSIMPFIQGQPTGASVTNVSHTEKGSVSPESRNDSKGTINTVRLSSVQQNDKWKAYVGNVSSTFVLDDANDLSIYQWTIDSFSGQVYITRDSTATWAGIACATAANKVTEDTALEHDPDAADSVNRTFSAQTHEAFTVGATSILVDTCFSAATWINDTSQTPADGQPFTEVLLWDGADMVYTTFVQNDVQGYNNLTNATYDFQAIVPDSTNVSVQSTYFFYLELS